MEEKKVLFYGGTFGACVPIIVFVACMITIAVMHMVSLVLFCIAGLVGLCAALILVKDKREFENAVIEGIQDNTLATIIFAFLLAGVLSQELRQSGLIQGIIWLMTVFNLNAAFLPVIAFICCCLISVATGTSNGAIVAVLPILLPVAASVGVNTSLMVGAIVSGAIFGDNLAPISDTTIASALTQEAEVKDVVRTRLPYALIAAGCSIVMYVIFGLRMTSNIALPAVADGTDAITLIMLAIPVIMVILMLHGWNLVGTLLVCDMLGVVFCLVFGFIKPSVMVSAEGPLGLGLTSMLNVICFCLFMFALLELLKRSGVFGLLIKKMEAKTKTPRQAELLTIGFEVIGGACIGAASVSILFVGPVVRKILQKQGIERTRGSNLLDGFGTSLGGLIPYNPMSLNAVSLALASGAVASSFSFIDYIPYLFHSYFLMLLFLLSVITGIGRRFEKPEEVNQESK